MVPFFVELMWRTSGMAIKSGAVAICLFLIGASTRSKCAMAPESAMELCPLFWLPQFDVMTV